ncbi:MAG TPA: S9 family peptidase [Candidatus Limnocylindrales bacterium]|nr:S9 family peptidase [Candidatus Limnocylindrales bacterium]
MPSSAARSAPDVESLANANTLAPPVARKIPKEIVVHGDKRLDDYFWLREKTNSDVRAYLEQENAYAEVTTKPLEKSRDHLYQEMLSHLKETDSSAPVRRGDYLYYTRTEAGKNYRIHCRKRGSLEATEEIILDENALAEGRKFFSIGLALPSDDNRFLAYTTDVTGYRQYTLQVKNLSTRELLPEKIERVDEVVWGTDNQTLFFVTENEVTKRQDEFYKHVLGTTATERLFFEPDELFDISVDRSRDRAFIFLNSESKLSSEVRFLPANQPDAQLRLVEPRAPDHKYFVTHRNDRFYIRTNDKAKNYKIVTTPVDRPGKAGWEEFIGHKPEVKLDHLDLFVRHAVLSKRENGQEQIEIVNLETKESHRVGLPEPTYELSVDENPEFHTTVLRIRYQSLVTPPTVYNYEMDRRIRTVVKQIEVPNYDASKYVSDRMFIPAQDGTRIPCSIVYKQGVQRNGHNPLLLYGYGSYGASVPVTFSFARLTLLDRGVIYVIAHIRGGGEMGEVWRDQGRMMQKRNTFTDFIACADYLVKNRYTSPDRLAITGGSAGGLLMGAVVNMRPDLFRLVIANVPFVDVLNTMLDPSLPLTTGEYIEWGNPNEKAAYDYMKTYSPYDNVRPQNYPTMLIRVSLNDSQVPYWEGAKFAAKLRAVKTDKNRLLLKTNMGAGHGGSSGRYEHLRDLAFDYSFLLHELGGTE